MRTNTSWKPNCLHSCAVMELDLTRYLGKLITYLEVGQSMARVLGGVTLGWGECVMIMEVGQVENVCIGGKVLFSKGQRCDQYCLDFCANRYWSKICKGICSHRVCTQTYHALC